MIRCALAVALVLALTALAAPARAWEPDTTHAGITEQAAVSSKLHERLTTLFGLGRGLYEPLTVPPADAPELFQVLGLLNPTHGYVPDTRGRQSALAWLVVGAVVADIPVAAARNHFLDVFTGGALDVAGGDAAAGWWARRSAERAVGDGTATALEWIDADDNPLALRGFYAQYRKAITARTPGERERHLAGALIAAGAALHVLQDMASPSHVRGDFAAHLEPLSADDTDLGSRFERVAALAYGRLGIPAAAEAVARPTVRAFYTDQDGGGLADVTARGFFSEGTLPRRVAITSRTRSAAAVDKLAGALRKPAPAVTGILDLIGARRASGIRLRNEAGVCLAVYRVVKWKLTWSLDDDCRLEQVSALLPRAVAYSWGLLDFLLRGELIVRAEGGGLQVSAGAVPLGAGKLLVLWDDARGVREALGAETDTAGGAAGAVLGTTGKPPRGARRIVALFDGVDAAGERIIAAGALTLGQ